jgi:phosphoglycolate phosphatase-like HAD superfamily hydrolase
MDIPANWWWRGPVPEPGDCVIFDMDGVLSDAKGRQHHLVWPRRDWGAFFAAAGDDAVFPDSAVLLGLLGEVLQVVLVTARPVSIRPATIDWLNRHEIPYDLLVMRPDVDRRASAAYKKSAVHELDAFGFTPRISFEDDLRNVEMFRAQGVPCVYIHSGYYD